MEDQEYLDHASACRFISRSKDTLNRAVRAGEIPKLTRPGSRRPWFRVTDLRRYIEGVAESQKGRAEK